MPFMWNFTKQKYIGRTWKAISGLAFTSLLTININVVQKNLFSKRQSGQAAAFKSNLRRLFVLARVPLCDVTLRLSGPLRISKERFNLYLLPCMKKQFGSILTECSVNSRYITIYKYCNNWYWNSLHPTIILAILIFYIR